MKHTYDCGPKLKFPFDPRVGFFGTEQDAIGQIKIHTGPHSAGRKDSSFAVDLCFLAGVFMTSSERRYCVLLYTWVNSKSTDCQKVNVQVTSNRKTTI